MAFDGNGNWISNFSAVADRNADIKILASRFDNIFIADLATSFENCLTKDAQIKPEQNFDANNFRVIDVANPVADNDAVNLGYLNTRIAAIEQDPILAYKWSDYEINDASWLNANTFSWHDGTVYTNAYTHLYNDLEDIESRTETIGSYTITYYQAEDGHKIVLPAMEETVQNIYAESGVAWYYILDTTNQRFKLPRTKYGFTGLRDTVGKYVPESLPNLTGSVEGTKEFRITSADGVFSFAGSKTQSGLANSSGSDYHKFSMDASQLSSTYQNGAPVQQRATQMYLYFYVGQFTQTAIEQTAGITTNQLEKKVDLNAQNLSDAGKSLIAGLPMPSDTYDDLTLGSSDATYEAPSNGYFYCEKVAGATNKYLNMVNTNSGLASEANPTGSDNRGRVWVPAKKGDIVSVGYNFTGTTMVFRFIYAEGSESEAS